MLFHYIASDKRETVVEGDLDAPDLNHVLQFLSAKELRPVSVKPIKELRAQVQPLFGKINISDKVFLTKYLSLMLKVGTDLMSAINILIADFDKPSMKMFLIEVRNNLSRGLPFYQAFARYPQVFSAVMVNLIKAAEASGNLQRTFEDMSTSLEKESELRKRVKSALIYPIILLVVGTSIFIFLSLFALPRIAKVFLDSGIKPPTFSRIVFGVGLFVGDHSIALLVGFIILGILAYLILGRTESGRRFLRRFLAHLPIIRNIYRDLAVQRFASTFSLLLRAGLPIIQATKITADVVGLDELRVALIRIADDGLAKGLTIGEAFRREPDFPRVVTNLVAISEKAGHLEDVLGTLADFYASNIDASVRQVVAFIEPALLLVMGILVATIALAIIVPIYQLTSQF
ncbi:MAG: type II secretion system F family protein [Candidatus Liptonbacteria bacterium]|nr:type II secretion system F family protein [Candidatus Liptonbacteria bacterium]